MIALVVTLHLLCSILLIGVVLMQSGKGGGLTGAFGMGGNQTLFGGRGAVDFLGKASWILGGAFMLLSLLLAILYGSATPSGQGGSLIKRQAATAPAVPGAGTAPVPVEQAPAGGQPTGDQPAGGQATEAPAPGGGQ